MRWTATSATSSIDDEDRLYVFVSCVSLFNILQQSMKFTAIKKLNKWNSNKQNTKRKQQHLLAVAHTHTLYDLSLLFKQMTDAGPKNVCVFTSEEEEEQSDRNDQIHIFQCICVWWISHIHRWKWRRETIQPQTETNVHVYTLEKMNERRHRHTCAKEPSQTM